MDCRPFWLALLGFLTWSGTSATASAITYKAEEVVFDGLPIYSAQNAPTLSNLTTGGSITLTNFGYSNSSLTAGPELARLISGSFGFLIQGFDASGNAVGPLLSVEGKYQGTDYFGGLPARESANFTGVASFVGSHFGDPVPDALQNLASNPGRLTIASFVSVGPSGDTNETVILTIAPQTIAPQTTPEPSTLILMASTLGIGWGYRSRRRKS